MAFPRNGQAQSSGHRPASPQGVILYSKSPEGTFFREPSHFWLHTRGQSVLERGLPSYAQCSNWKGNREVRYYGNLKHLSSSPVNFLCVQAAELDGC